MSSEQVFDDPGKARPKPSQEAAGPQMEQGTTASAPLTKADIEGKLDPQKIKRMQQTMGNAAVQRFLAQRSAEGSFEVDDDTASAIREKKGSGQALDEGVAQKAGSVLGQDFSHVNVHTDSKADALSRKVGAKAFTTGSDIFFKQGAYAPKSDEGQKLISHELTHVVQQGEGVPEVQGKMTVNDPNDQYEAEADKVADTVMSQPDDAVQRAMSGDEVMEKRDDAVQRAAPEEEEAAPDAQAKRDNTVQRAAPDEEVMDKRDDTVQRAAPDEEVMDKRDDTVQRAAPDEEVMDKRDDTVQREGEEEELPEQPVSTKRDDALQLQVTAPEEEEPPIREKPDETVQRVFDIEEAVPEAQEKRDDAVQREEEEVPMDLKRDDALQLQGDVEEEEDKPVHRAVDSEGEKEGIIEPVIFRMLDTTVQRQDEPMDEDPV